MKVDIKGSGSKGNCAVIDDTIVIDAGINVKDILATHVLITHVHSDHTKHLANFSGLQIYALQETIDKLREKAEFKYMAINVIEPNVPFGIYDTAGMYQYSVKPIPVTHDVPCVAFEVSRFDLDTRKTKRIFFGTDFSAITDEENFVENVKYELYNHIYIECNNSLSPLDFHDIHFPENGEKPPKDAFHRERSFNNHASVNYLRRIFELANYNERRPLKTPVTLLHKSSFYYAHNTDALLELGKIVNVTNLLDQLK